MHSVRPCLKSDLRRTVQQNLCSRCFFAHHRHDLASQGQQLGLREILFTDLDIVDASACPAAGELDQHSLTLPLTAGQKLAAGDGVEEHFSTIAGRDGKGFPHWAEIPTPEIHARHTLSGLRWARDTVQVSSVLLSARKTWLLTIC